MTNMRYGSGFTLSLVYCPGLSTTVQDEERPSDGRDGVRKGEMVRACTACWSKCAKTFCTSHGSQRVPESFIHHMLVDVFQNLLYITC